MQAVPTLGAMAMKISALLLCALAPGLVSASLTFSRGELVFTGYNSDNPDEFGFFTTVPIDAGATISFTDDGWFAVGGLRTNEGIISWTNDTGGAIGAFSEILVQGTASASEGSVSVMAGSFALSASGDQLLAFQGALPTGNSDIIGALQMNGAWDADATSANSSAQPGTGFMSLAITPELDNAYYTGPTSFA